MFRTDEYKQMNLPSEKQIGLIAQDLEEVFPELVKDIGEMKVLNKEGKFDITPGFKSVQYTGLIPVLIGGIQDQQKLRFRRVHFLWKYGY